ncbi:type VI secretion system tip protein TssI/VgrG [Zooshikella ganghwensis]|uniref:Type VI secretion system tip protein VgrG n=1 Tax=Zooshikella ganghwensis TaxID=202772 RepID=A0A4P9VIU8_9GAMM|nr:type VI secretion system tip protein TssI/VgrG [Zooshikella ganghwensis]RDH42117.1 type VI secretion system tip protein VgrG [Zooshikella ganghwensis]
MSLAANETIFYLKLPSLTDTLNVTSFIGHEGISQLFHYSINAVSINDNIDPVSMLLQPVTLTIVGEDFERQVNGIINQFAQGKTADKYTEYSFDFIPKLWYLTKRTDCRIFQALTIPEIIKQVLEVAEFIEKDDFIQKLTGNYQPHDYIVQYNETDFNFISRLLEQEGIFYFFEHQVDSHCLVLSDHNAAFGPIEGESVEFHGKTGLVPDYEVVDELYYTCQRTIGKVELDDYNFTKPNLDLYVTASQGDESLVDYQFPGGYQLPEQGQRYAQLRLEAFNTFAEKINAQSTCRRLLPGYVVDLERHPRTSLNQSYIICQVMHEGEQPQGQDEYATSEEGSWYRNHGLWIPKTVPFRPPLKAKAPKMPGKQSAVVTGPKGEEIYTERFGRIKAQFHWDRLGQHNEHSSRWMRVMQTWAGKQWGALLIPRIGQEITIDYLHGDINQPVVTGVVYNGRKNPPYPLPKHKTRSGFRTDSTIGSGGYNELSFEDKQGAEQIRIHGEKDSDLRVKNDSREEVVEMRHHKIVDNHYLKIKQDNHLKVDQQHERVVKGDIHHRVGDTQHSQIDGDHLLDAGQEWQVTSGHKIVIESDREVVFYAGGSFIKIDHSGVYINGPSYNLGGGSASGAQQATATTPAAPMEADKDFSGNFSLNRAKLTGQKAKHFQGKGLKKIEPEIYDEEAKQRWIKIRVVDEQNEPYKGVYYQLLSANQKQLFEDFIPSDGVIYKTKLVDTNYKLTLKVWDLICARRLKKEAGTEPVREWLENRPASWQYQFHAYPEDIKNALLADIDDGGRLVDEEPFISKTADEYFGGINTEIDGLAVCQRHCIEIESLVSYVPILVDSRDYHYINAYNMGMGCLWVYSDWGENEKSNNIGSLQDVLTKLARHQKTELINTQKFNFLLETAPFADRMMFPRLFINKLVGAEALIICQGKRVIIFVRGTEGSEWQLNKLEVVWGKPINSELAIEIAPGIIARYLLNIDQDTKVTKSLNIIYDSPGFKDVVTDGDAEQVPFVPAQSRQDKLLDEWVPFIDSNAPRVHKGFNHYVKSIWGSIEQYLLRHKEQVSFCFIAGHSLGGAAATLMGAIIQEKKLFNMPVLYTYGSPRVGTRRFVERYKSIPHFRHVNNRDMVPMVPFQSISGGLSDLVSFVKRQKIILQHFVGNGVTNPFSIPVVALSSTMSTIASSGKTVLDMKNMDEDHYLHHGQLQQILTIENSHFIIGLQSLGLTHQGLATLMYYLAHQQYGQDLRTDGDNLIEEGIKVLDNFFSPEMGNGLLTIDKATLQQLNLDPIEEIIESGKNHSMPDGYILNMKYVLKKLLKQDDKYKHDLKFAINHLLQTKKILVNFVNKMKSIGEESISALRASLRSPHTIDNRAELRKSLEEKRHLLELEIDFYITQINKIESDIALFDKILIGGIPEDMLVVKNLDKDSIYDQLK